jgi:hypothetical protein
MSPAQDGIDPPERPRPAGAGLRGGYQPEDASTGSLESSFTRLRIPAGSVATHQTRETLRPVVETRRRLAPFVIAAPSFPPAWRLQ